ncbi:MAG: PAS domain-containing protein, partial [Lutibacter sp.]
MNTISIKNTYQEIFESFPKIEIEEHIKKLIELDFYYPYNATFFCITNTISQNFEYVSKNFNSITGLNKNDLINGGMNYFWSRFHKDDIDLWLKSLQTLMNFTMNDLDEEKRKRMSYTWNYRFKNAKGKFVNIIQNTTPLQFDENNKPVIGLAHYTVLNESIPMDICASAKYLNGNNEYETLFFSNLTNKNLI